jgi:uncharacterized YigZ family protein
MQCVKAPIEIEDVLKKSRFIATIAPCQTENECLRLLNQQHQTHLNASHIAFAYRIKTAKEIVTRFHDAGEPSGTAGKPIFQYLQGHDIINALLIVVRYFGGIKLGAGGLTRAYGNAAKKAIAACTLNNYIEYIDIKLALDYKQLQNFEYQLKKLNGEIVTQEFFEKVTLLVRVPKINLSTLMEQFTAVEIS